MRKPTRRLASELSEYTSQLRHSARGVVAEVCRESSAVRTLLLSANG
jgi:hypothetical protein